MSGLLSTSPAIMMRVSFILLSLCVVSKQMLRIEDAYKEQLHPFFGIL